MLGVAVALVLNAFQSNLVFFFTPTQVVAQGSAAGPAVPHRRHGRRRAASCACPIPSTCSFVVTDTVADACRSCYSGLLPDLFKEGKGVVAQGTLGADGTFRATEVLAKHDENYMPPEAAAARDGKRSKGAASDKAMRSMSTPR